MPIPIAVNSGCANAVKGAKGTEDAWAMVRAADALLTPPHPPTAPTSEALVLSTGVIGQHLPIGRILDALRTQVPSSLGTGFRAWERAATAFMTTDTFPKLRAPVGPLVVEPLPAVQMRVDSLIMVRGPNTVRSKMLIEYRLYGFCAPVSEGEVEVVTSADEIVCGPF